MTADIPFEAVGTQARIARVYAEAILAIAAQDQQVEAIGAELVLVVQATQSDPAVLAYFADASVNKASRLPVLAAGFEQGTSPALRKFLGVLNENQRLSLLPAIAAEYRKLLDARLGRVRVTVTSAVRLSDPQIEQLTGTLRRQLQAEPILTIYNNPEILGGLIVQVGDKVYDTSVRARLDQLRTHLLTSGNHGG